MPESNKWIGAWPCLLSLLLLAAGLVVGDRLVAEAPAGFQLERVTLNDCNVSNERVIGRNALGQSARSDLVEKHHIRLRCHDDGSWTIANTARQRRVYLNRDGGAGRYLRRWPIEAGDRLSIGAEHIHVVEADNERFRLRLARLDKAGSIRDSATYDVGLWLRSTIPQTCDIDPCIDPSWRGPLVRAVRRQRLKFERWIGMDRNDRRLFYIGGGVGCANRWKIDTLPDDAVSIHWQSGRFWLVSRKPGVAVRAARRDSGESSDLRTLETPLARRSETMNHSVSIIVGRTRYRVVHDGRLTLIPTDRIAFLGERQTPESEPTGVQQVWQFRRWIGEGAPIAEIVQSLNRWWIAAALSGIVLTSLLIRRRREARSIWDRPKPREAGTPLWCDMAVVALLVVAAWCSGWRQPPIGLDGLLLAGWLVWASVTVVLMRQRRLAGIAGWIWTLGLLQAMVAAIVLTQLAAGSGNTHWTEYPAKQLQALIWLGAIVGVSSIIPVRRLSLTWRNICSERFPEYHVFMGLVTISMILLLAQAVFGSEYGVFGIQPAELAKFLVAVLAGIYGVRFQETRRDDFAVYRNRPWLLAWDGFRLLVLLVVIVLVLFVSLGDFSPLVILGCFGVVFTWVLIANPRTGTVHSFAGRTLRGLIGTGVVVAALLVVSKPAFLEPVAASMPESRRLQVWLALDRHVSDGYQVVQSRRSIRDGGWLPQSGPFGSNGDVMRQPVVASDFIGTFIMNRFGYAAAFGLMTVQALYALSLLTLGLDMRPASASYDFQQRQARWGALITLVGLAWMHIAHWLIAWANVVGLLPVMGQPMSWISAGRSHLLFFVGPSFVLALATAWWKDDPTASDSR